MIKVKVLLLICVFSACCNFCFASTGGSYKVKVNTYLNVRSGPGPSYSSIGTLKNGAQINVSSINGEWAQISYSGQTGYVNKKYLQKVSSSPASNSSSRYSSTNEYSGEQTFLKVIVGLFIAFLLVNYFDGPSSIYLILFFLVPTLLCYYLTTAYRPIWFMSTSYVSWLWIIVNGFGMLLMAATFWGMIKSLFMDMLRDRRFDWFSIIALLVYVPALYLLITTAITEFLIIGVLMIIGSASGSSYVGEFTDRHGNRWEVWRK